MGPCTLYSLSRIYQSPQLPLLSLHTITGRQAFPGSTSKRYILHPFTRLLISRIFFFMEQVFVKKTTLFALAASGSANTFLSLSFSSLCVQGRGFAVNKGDGATSNNVLQIPLPLMRSKFNIHLVFHQYTA
jgi:hypothetical protein